jgi:transposase
VAIVIERKTGSTNRFNKAGQFTSYTGLVPSVHASCGKNRFGHIREPSNQYLKRAFFEAANLVAHHRHYSARKTKYDCQVYDRVCQRKGHPTGIGAAFRAA